MSQLPIFIPQDFVVNVKKGESVLSGQVIARRNASSEKRIPLASLLGVSGKKARKYVHKEPGDSIKTGEIIAVKPSIVSVTEVVSTVSGTVLGFDRESGDILFEKTSESSSETADVVAPFNGVIASIEDGKVLLDIKNGDGVVGKRGVGASANGLLILAGKDMEVPIGGVQIIVSMIGNIVLGPSFSTEALVKASGMGIAGIVALKINPADIELLDQKRMLLPLLEVDLPTWQALAKQEGKKVYLDPVAKTVLVS